MNFSTKTLLIGFLLISISHASGKKDWIYFNNNFSTMDEWIRAIHASPQLILTMDQAAKDLTNVLKHYEIDHTIFFGTQLGAALTNPRETGSIIPNDDDIGIDYEDLGILCDLKPTFEAMEL